MSPEIKDDSDCFLTVSFHILLIRLCVPEEYRALVRVVDAFTELCGLSVGRPPQQYQCLKHLPYSFRTFF